MPLSCNLGTLTSWNRLGHSRPATGLLYLFYGAQCVTFHNYFCWSRAFISSLKILRIGCNRNKFVYFFLGNSPASEFYMPTFRNTLFHLHRRIGIKMKQTECSETSAYKIQTPGELPRRQHTTFRTRRKFEIKK